MMASRVLSATIGISVWDTLQLRAIWEKVPESSSRHHAVASANSPERVLWDLAPVDPRDASEAPPTQGRQKRPLFRSRRTSLRQAQNSQSPDARWSENASYRAGSANYRSNLCAHI